MITMTQLYFIISTNISYVICKCEKKKNESSMRVICVSVQIIFPIILLFVSKELSRRNDWRISVISSLVHVLYHIGTSALNKKYKCLQNQVADHENFKHYNNYCEIFVVNKMFLFIKLSNFRY